MGVGGAFTLMAQAPSSPSTTSPSRSLAAVQEEGFDQKLNRYRYCYGIHVTYDNASDARRRACKALLVHKLGGALEQPGSYFSAALHFECQNTAAGYTELVEWQTKPVFRLKPNQEYEVLDRAMQNYLVKNQNSAQWLRAQRSCDFYLDCRNSLSLSRINFHNIKRCFLDVESGIVGRTLQREVLSLVFDRESEGFIIPRMLEGGEI